MTRSAVLGVAAALGIAGISFTACNYADGPGEGPIMPSRDSDGDALRPSTTDLRGNNGGSCSNGPATVAVGTYTYCSGQCASKCPAGGVSGFSPSVFKFTTTIPDDGTDKGGGWQEATGTLNFFRWTSLLPEAWSCTITVGMPLRTTINGKISAQAAATLTAGVASEASFTVMSIKPELPPGIFCFKFKEEMRSLFAKPALSTYGASVK